MKVTKKQYYCDFCGNKMNEENLTFKDGYKLKLRKMEISKSHSGVIIFEDICPNCEKKLIDFLKINFKEIKEIRETVF